MKKYLEHLADDLDYTFTQVECQDDWREAIIEVIYKNLKAYENYAEGTLRKLLKDMEEGIQQ